MAENLSIESPDFEAIRKEAGANTRDAVNLLWTTLNYEMRLRSQTVAFAQNTLQGKAIADAPTTQQNNYDTLGALTVTFTGGTAFNLTGFRNGIAGRVILIHNTGTGMITVKHQNAGSDASNRLVTVTGADKTIATGQSAVFHYSQSVWQMASFQ